MHERVQECKCLHERVCSASARRSREERAAPPRHRSRVFTEEKLLFGCCSCEKLATLVKVAPCFEGAASARAGASHSA